MVNPADGEERGLKSGIPKSLSDAIDEEQTEMASICLCLTGEGGLTLMMGLSVSLMIISLDCVEMCG